MATPLFIVNRMFCLCGVYTAVLSGDAALLGSELSRHPISRRIDGDLGGVIQRRSRRTRPTVGGAESGNPTMSASGHSRKFEAASATSALTAGCGHGR